VVLSLYLTVSDGGPGLRANVLEQYHHPAHAKHPPRQGIGLGVWTIWLLVSRLGGWIAIDGAAGLSSTITVTLPLRREMSLDAVP